MSASRLDEDFRIRKRRLLQGKRRRDFPESECADRSAAVSLMMIEDILQHNQDVIVIVDEAYIDFGGTFCTAS